MIKTILPHIGNKSKALGFVLPFIHSDTDVFIEPFCGSCAVTIGLLQSRPQQFKHIICADLNKDIINFWRLVQIHGEELCTMILNLLDSITDLKAFTPEGDLNQALFYYIKARCSYYNNINKDFNFTSISKLSGGFTSVERNRFEYMKVLLKDVEFKHMGYQESITYAKTLSSKLSAFVDPPYPSESFTSFYAFDFVDIADIINNCQDVENVVITYSDNDFCKEYGVSNGFKLRLINLRDLIPLPRTELYLYK